MQFLELARRGVVRPELERAGVLRDRRAWSGGGADGVWAAPRQGRPMAQRTRAAGGSVAHGELIHAPIIVSRGVTVQQGPVGSCGGASFREELVRLH